MGCSLALHIVPISIMMFVHLCVFCCRAVLPVELLHGITFACGWGAGTINSKRVAPPELAATMQVGSPGQDAMYKVLKTARLAAPPVELSREVSMWSMSWHSTASLVCTHVEFYATFEHGTPHCVQTLVALTCCYCFCCCF